MVLGKLDMNLQPRNQKANHIQGCIQSSVPSRSSEVILPLCPSVYKETFTPEHCIQLWGPQNRKDGAVGPSPEKGHEEDSEAAAPLL